MTVAAPFHRPRLTGSRTLVWRSRTDLQIGLDDDAVVLAAVPRHTEDLVRLLDGHHTLHVTTIPALWQLPKVPPRVSQCPSSGCWARERSTRRSAAVCWTQGSGYG